MVAAAPRRLPRGALLALLLGFMAALLALGGWQLQRLSWKRALIARVEARVQAAPQPAPEREDWPWLSAQHDDYRHVRLHGLWLHEHSAWVSTATALGSGYWLMTPMRRVDGSVVWVNRGFVSPASRARWRLAESAPGEATGLLRMSETGRPWLRENAPEAERWYARDVQALSARRGLGPTAPYFVDADANAGSAGEPIGGLTVVHFRNPHLLYALTWFALAALAGWGSWRVWREPLSLQNPDSP